jgi:2-C-methyl-D-erythritol 4-phosphate cytidylyltransferase
VSINSKKYVIIPAAGIGSRMNDNTPKQYLKLSNNTTILDSTLECFIGDDFFDKIIISLSSDDILWSKSKYFNHDKIIICTGGDTRFDSVFNAVRTIINTLDSDSWVFVHDAARPCVQSVDIKNLYIQVSKSSNQCGILAIKAFETVKKVIDCNITETIDRSHIWLAQTPQLATASDLFNAFNYCVDNYLSNKITDESSALEYYGIQPIVVEGSRSNIKVTTQEDLLFLEWFNRVS